MAEIDRFLVQMHDNYASDLHLSAGLPPRFRINGDLMDAEPDRMNAEQTQNVLFEILTEKQQHYFHNRKDIDFVYLQMQYTF